ncbi:hypothetical protein M422DRAFT_259150 [Sphaerobolus stellatus SS14]|uniref:Uncharacterized protein n=1 Tax=Sphaerobolus stellatus (strain SS14) TaxID=990650 RepID=A0A0C9VKG6_SPHS4|nr:hypothetical protein M422DRAFT_259150 [Sphaerobolus stellatus SS14]
MRAEDNCTCRLIDTSNALRTARHTDNGRTLLSHLSDSPATTRQNPPNAATGEKKKFLPKLTEEEKNLIRDHLGCRRCHTFYAGHQSANCPMTIVNTWPNTSNYTPLTESMAWVAAAAAKPRITVALAYSKDPRDAETDLYVPPTPFTIPHLYAQMDLTGPAMEDFPLSVKALLDIGSPAVIISSGLVDQLGL